MQNYKIFVKIIAFVIQKEPYHFSKQRLIWLF